MRSETYALDFVSENFESHGDRGPTSRFFASMALLLEERVRQRRVYAPTFIGAPTRNDAKKRRHYPRRT